MEHAVRFCVDYRKLNQNAKFDTYPMLRVEEVLEHIGQGRFITTLDLAKGYWQIPMAKDSREITAFSTVTPFGLFEFLVMPFGLHTAPATFQRLMNELLRDCQQFSGAYLDDVVIFSSSWADHLNHLSEVFTCLCGAGLTVKPSKCRFAFKEVQYRIARNVRGQKFSRIKTNRKNYFSRNSPVHYAIIIIHPGPRSLPPTPFFAAQDSHTCLVVRCFASVFVLRSIQSLQAYCSVQY